MMMEKSVTHPVVVLRAPEPGDVDTMYNIENDPQIWADGVTFAPLSHKQLYDYVDGYDGDIYATGQLRLIIELCEGKAVVGVVDLYDYDKINRRAYIGITVVSSIRSKGVGKAALQTLCDYCSDKLDMKQLSAVIRADNHSCLAMFARCGFVETGRFPQWVRRGHTWIDAVHMQRLL